MGRLRDYDWAISYSTSNVTGTSEPVDILHQFYIPVLERSIRYDRVAGYFSSSSLAAASRGFSRFVADDGRARFIVGAELDQDDVDAIIAGDEKRLERRLEEALGDEESWPERTRRGVELLTWMVAQDRLEIRVAVRIDERTGQPRTLDFHGDGYVHEKWAIFEDDTDGLVAAGSLNESRTALELNAENLEIFLGWEGRDARRLAEKRQSFEAMWAGTHAHIRTYSLPEAVRQKLIRIAKRVEKPREIDDPDDEVLDDHLTPDLRERLRFAWIRLAPLLPGGEYVGMETAPVEPWPHQWFAARRLIETYPDSHLLCDEVGLGKTIEAGLAFRSLWLCGAARSIRVFAPASLTVQWLYEMSEKFLLTFHRRTSREGHHETADLLTGEVASGFSAPFSEPLEIYSTGLIVHDRSRRFLEAMPDTDLILVDEAHKARRHQPDQTARPPDFNRLYRALDDQIFPKARALLLATATPMQLNPVEAFDLIRFMPGAGAVRCVPELGQLLYLIRDSLLDQEDLGPERASLLQRYLHDVRKHAPAQWEFVMERVLSDGDRLDLELFLDSGAPPMDWQFLQPALSMLMPLGRVMLRHTRGLLREYERDGRLAARLAHRDVQPVIVGLEGQERVIYENLQAYAEELSARISASTPDDKSRAAIGFYLCFLRLRFASSIPALERSLGNRLEKIQRTLDHHAQATPEIDAEDAVEEMPQQDLAALVLRNRTDADLTWELGAVGELLESVKALSTMPCKTLKLLELVQRRQIAGTNRVRQMVVFTKYQATLDHLYAALARRLPGTSLATFSGEGGKIRRSSQANLEGASRTTVRQHFVAGEVDILLCTDAAAEGLNLQSADLLVNFDLPWNPMLLEQRIGRIDRIGQRHEQITVVNMLYQGSVEEVVYDRLVKRFQSALRVSGQLQFSLLPIEEQDLQDYAKGPGEDGRITWDQLLARAEKHAGDIARRQKLTELDPGAQKAAYVAMESDKTRVHPPVTLDDIWHALADSSYLRNRGASMEQFPHGEALCLRGIPSLPEEPLLTVSRALYERGLPTGDPRELHFASYGDPVFEELLTHILATEAGVRAAHEHGGRLDCLIAGQERISSLAQVDAFTAGETSALGVVSAKTAEISTGASRLETGEWMRRLVNRSAASLAEKKLVDTAQSPSNQLQHVDEFIRDVRKRSPAAVKLPVSLDNKSGFLARKELLLWDVEDVQPVPRVRLDADALHVLRSQIEQALNALNRDSRTSSAVAARLRAYSIK